MSKHSTNFLPQTLEPFLAYLEFKGFSYKISSVLPVDGVRIYQARMWHNSWPPGMYGPKRTGSTALEALQDALVASWRKGAAYRKAQRLKEAAAPQP